MSRFTSISHIYFSTRNFNAKHEMFTNTDLANLAKETCCLINNAVIKPFHKTQLMLSCNGNKRILVLLKGLLTANSSHGNFEEAMAEHPEQENYSEFITTAEDVMARLKYVLSFKDKEYLNLCIKSIKYNCASVI